MLDRNLCPPMTYTWVEWTWQFSYFLTKPINFPLKFIWLVLFVAIVSLFLVALRSPTWKRWILRQLHWQRWWTRTAIILTVVTLLITSPPGLALATQVLVSLVPQKAVANADAIVVLGRGFNFEGARAETALALWQAKQAPKIFISGHGDAERLVRKLEAEGVPAQALNGEECSLTTEQNATFSAKILVPQGVKRIVLVTDPPHMLRAFLTFQSQGFEVIPHTTSLPNNLSYRQKMMITFREYGGLVSYVLKGHIFERGDTA
ncbi:YdcF family protein [Kovacikia minuta CCNUW1]|uniref:YdcF family protein n=1 Tax=Kovacikia minuta TaxID=2931930 RepID=UPI001CC98244|nr:YdcF family protein [Kovacikia minuta]UBF28961.1 YdcF family protein [Kovacikia minuta CCNUW1]